MDTNKWWFETNGEQKGPVDEEEIGKLIGYRLLNKDSLIWTEGMTAWAAVSTTKFNEFVSVPTQPITTENKKEIPTNELPISEVGEVDLRFLSNSRYYQSEFKKIIESGEKYKGSWNWGAFLFTSIWCFSRGCWEVGLMIVVGYIANNIVDSSLALGFGLGSMILMGTRGTWILYNVKKKKNFPG